MGVIFLMATLPPVSLFLAAHTTPYAPLPSALMGAYFLSILNLVPYTARGRGWGGGRGEGAGELAAVESRKEEDGPATIQWVDRVVVVRAGGGTGLEKAASWATTRAADSDVGRVILRCTPRPPHPHDRAVTRLARWRLARAPPKWVAVATSREGAAAGASLDEPRCLRCGRNDTVHRIAASRRAAAQRAGALVGRFSGCARLPSAEGLARRSLMKAALAAPAPACTPRRTRSLASSNRRARAPN